MATPLMKQYTEVKQRHQDAILLYRLGDFYELFHDDAVIASKLLGLTLTSRNNGKDGAKTPLAGFPYHSVEKYIPKLVQAGHKVAICEQVEDPAQAKGVVKRDVVEVITRGTAINDNCLEAKENNYLAAVYPGEGVCGLAYLDVSTGTFAVLEGDAGQVLDELSRLDVREVLHPEDIDWLSEENLSVNTEKEVEEQDQKGMQGTKSLALLKEQDKVLVTILPKGNFHIATSRERLQEQFQVHSLDAFDCAHYTWGLGAAGAILTYVKDHKKTELNHLIGLTPKRFDEQMHLDGATIRNLELVRPLHADDESGTLCYLMDKTVTAMGGRELKYWLTHPLLNKVHIEKRLDAVQELLERDVLQDLRRPLREINDIERIVSKVGAKRVHARDLQGLGKSLIQAAEVGQQLNNLISPLLAKSADTLTHFLEMGQELVDQFVEKPPLTIREGNMLNSEKHPELLQILQDAREGKQWLNNLETSVKKETGIPTLKVGYNKVFGYYIEVSKIHISKVPEDFIRKQTLTNAERYITPEMKEWESKILNSEGKANSVEYDLFCKIREDVASKIKDLLTVAKELATIDVLCSLAVVAREQQYSRPILEESGSLKIENGRHPVVEALTEEGQYIPNDVHLSTTERQILLITGPNMAGKSTYLRQVALITLMAQIGSYVPADAATIGLVDRIFTRVGASDRLARGQSTFMVEMIETASILHNATPKSLILLDEIGRGTSTFDGLSLAWSIVEALHENTAIAARTLFATHYHELTVLPSSLGRAVNVQVSVKESGKKVIFLRKILEGACDSSYGIQVAGMAGIPQPIIDRAWDILHRLEGKLEGQDGSVQVESAFKKKKSEKVLAPSMNSSQADLFATSITNPLHQKIFDKVMEVDVNSITPMELMNTVVQWQRDIKTK
jgi:DNA mismatch repair protein MutS